MSAVIIVQNLTISKVNESDARDYKGQNRKCNAKSLLSAEDIFATKKEGECAIVVKGAEPLYQTKCRMPPPIL